MDKLLDEHFPKVFLLLFAASLWGWSWTFTMQGMIGALIVFGVALWREHELSTAPKSLLATYLMPRKTNVDVRRIFEFAQKNERISVVMAWNDASLMRINGVYKCFLETVKRENNQVVMVGDAGSHTYNITVTRYRDFAGAVDHRWVIVKTETSTGEEEFRLVDESVWFTEDGADLDRGNSLVFPSKPIKPVRTASPPKPNPKPEVTIEKAGTSSGSPKITIAVSDIDWEALKASSSVPFLLKK